MNLVDLSTDSEKSYSIAFVLRVRERVVSYGNFGQRSRWAWLTRPVSYLLRQFIFTIFYFPTIEICFGTNWNFTRDWLDVDPWLKVDLGSWLARTTTTRRGAVKLKSLRDRYIYGTWSSHSICTQGQHVDQVAFLCSCSVCFWQVWHWLKWL